MAARIRFVNPPEALAGVMTVQCECGWEVVSIQPEENMWLIQILFNHLHNEHAVRFPSVTFNWH